jgi:hypothetical protein
MVMSVVVIVLVTVVLASVGWLEGRRGARREEVPMWAGVRMRMDSSPVTMFDRAHAASSVRPITAELPDEGR